MVVKRNKRLANVQSIAVAKAAVAYAGKNAKISPQDFLPYEVEKKARVSNQTARIFMSLMDKLPHKIISACGDLVDEMAKLTE